MSLTDVLISPACVHLSRLCGSAKRVWTGTAADHPIRRPPIGLAVSPWMLLVLGTVGALAA
jgi:hypothetical protein